MATSSIPPVSGIYKIACAANGKIYVGSSQDIERRWQQHKRNLNKNRHSNPHLQGAWNKYGEQVFILEIIEYVLPWGLIDREQFWLDKLKPYDKTNGFNIAKKADAPTLGKPMADSTKEKLRAINLGKKQSPELIEKRIAPIRGRKHTSEHRAKVSASKMGNTNSKGQDFIVTSPDGTDYFINNLSRFCKQNGLAWSSMANVAAGRRKQCKGWKCRHA